MKTRACCSAVIIAKSGRMCACFGRDLSSITVLLRAQFMRGETYSTRCSKLNTTFQAPHPLRLKRSLLPADC